MKTVLQHRLLPRIYTPALNTSPTKLSYLYFHPLEVVSRYRGPQRQVTENYTHIFF